jgi:nitroreductase
MDLREAIYSRRAAREFTPEPLVAEVLRQLIDAAHLTDAAIPAPSLAPQSEAMAIYGRTGQRATCAHFAGGNGPFAQNLGGGVAIASLPERSRKS